jgi:HEAT repeat protein
MNALKRIGLVLVVVAIALAAVATITNFTTEATTAPITTTNAEEEANIAALQSDSAEERAIAAQELAGTDNDVAITALLANLADGDPAAGYFTAIALAASESPSVMASLVAELNNPDPIVRQRAAVALSHMEGDIAVDALAPALEDGATAAPVAEILVNMDDEKAHEVVLTALADEEYTTRRHAVMAAIESADPVVQDFILGRALGSDNLILRSNAMELRDFIGS